YPDNLRARMMALTSSAWIVPALLGPTLAGFVAEAFHWRWVVWGILPLLALVAALTVRPFGALRSGGEAPAERGGGPRSRGLRSRDTRLGTALILALGAGLFLFGVGLESVWLALASAVPGAVLAGYGLNALLPSGTLRLARGLPSVVAARGTL